MAELWIENQSESARHWLKGSACPMLASKADGSILWANEAAERLLGYSLAELVTTAESPGLSWEDLTMDRADLRADQLMVKSLIHGDRHDYTLQKSYRSKRGDPLPSVIHVLRWPPLGDVDCFLVTLTPLRKASDAVLKELARMREAIAAMNASPVAARSEFWPMLAKAGVWANENKLAAAALVLWLSALIAGDRVIVVAERIHHLFTK